MIYHTLGKITDCKESILLLSINPGRLLGEGHSWDTRKAMPKETLRINDKVKDKGIRKGDCLVVSKDEGLLACLYLPEIHTSRDINFVNIRDIRRALSRAKTLIDGIAFDIAIPDDLLYSGGALKIHEELLKLILETLGTGVHIVSGTKRKFDNTQKALRSITSQIEINTIAN